jgi:hypothetical protein
LKWKKKNFLEKRKKKIAFKKQNPSPFGYSL